jgi:cytochrome c-type biogenesis protein CcmH
MTDTIESLRDQLLKLKSLHDSGALDAQAYDAARTVAERRLADLVTSGPATPSAPAPRAPRRLVAALAAGVLAVAAGGYWWTGTPQAMLGGTSEAAAAGGAGAPHSVDRAQIAAMVEKLAERLKERPDDAEGLRMLGRSYMVLGQPADAVAAYRQSLKIAPDNADALADYADALGVRNGRDLSGEPTKLIERALQVDPNHLKALMLAGSAAYNRQAFAEAARYWDRMVAVGPADHPMVREAAQVADEARQLAGQAPKGAASGAAGRTAPAAAASASVAGSVTLAAALKDKAAPGDTVFVFARAAEGPRMPLAIVRAQVKDLPLQFTLDDSQAMSPSARLSTAGRVVVGARISKSGNATPQPGDLEGFSAPVAVGSGDVRVTIDRPLP